MPSAASTNQTRVVATLARAWASRILRLHSHGLATVATPDDLLAKIAKQCGLTKPQFLRLIECPLQRPEYETLLRAADRL